ncbi:MAG: hypothetical protein ACPMAQ_09805, partial [Phycisphaerae bacterium]
MADSERNTGAQRQAESQAAAPAGVGSIRKRRPAVLLVLILAIGGGIYGGYWYVWGLSHEDTDDAQVEGNICPISSKVAGYVAERLVTAQPQLMQRAAQWRQFQ